MNAKYILAMDLGATKCAAGIIQYSQHRGDYVCERDCRINLSDTTSLQDLIRQIEAELNCRFADMDAVCAGAAGQFNGEELCHLEGVYPYPMRFAELARRENWPHYTILHDYDTVVCATFTSYMHDKNNLLLLNQRKADPCKRRVAFGLGTGVGLKDGVLFPDGNFWLGKNEIGHIGIVHPPAASDDTLRLHQELLKFMREQENMASHLPVTFENVLTGRGLVNMHNFLYPQHATCGNEVGKKLAAGEAPELMQLFAWYLGLFIGTVQLIFMPEGGIWMTGGVALNNLDVFKQPALHEGIKASPAYLSERSHYPLGVLTNPQHALIGAGFYAVNRLLKAGSYLPDLETSSVMP